MPDAPAASPDTDALRRRSFADLVYQLSLYLSHSLTHALSFSCWLTLAQNSRATQFAHNISRQSEEWKRNKKKEEESKWQKEKEKNREWHLERNRKQTKREGGNMKWVRQKAQLSNKKRDTNTEGARARERERERQAEREELESERKKPKERHLLHDIAKDRFCWAILHSSSCKNSVIEDK